jgi:hypothetical protein
MFSRLWKRSRASRAAGQFAGIEPLEDRLMLSAVIDQVAKPQINYNNGGATAFDAGTGEIHVTARPVGFQGEGESGLFASGQIDWTVQVDATGQLLGGVAGDDLVVSGALDRNGDFVIDQTGTLLTGEIIAFGFEELGATDRLSYVFEVTGGLLAAEYAGSQIGILQTIENSTFDGNFTQDFTGGAKGQIGLVDYIQPEPGIAIEKLTNGVDADTVDEAVSIAAGDTVTWTYQVTNTGNVAFSFDELSVIDDNGTPSDASDDFAPTLDSASDVGGDGILSPGEVWTYEATGVAQDLGAQADETARVYLTGSTAIDGEAGNIRTFEADGVEVNATAFSRTDGGTWQEAYLGSYSHGLGVTDTSENGSNGTHRTDNRGRDNYVVLTFDENVVIDRVYLDSVVNDSDIKVWIGTVDGAFDESVVLSDGLLDSFHSETNTTSSSDSRWADINSDGVEGNVIVIAARPGEKCANDAFKIKKVDVDRTNKGTYKNKAAVAARGVGASDISHYVNPVDDDGGCDWGDKWDKWSGWRHWKKWGQWDGCTSHKDTCHTKYSYKKHSKCYSGCYNTSHKSHGHHHKGYSGSHGYSSHSHHGGYHYSGHSWGWGGKWC